MHSRTVLCKVLNTKYDQPMIGHTLGWIPVRSQPKCVVDSCRGTFGTLQVQPSVSPIAVSSHISRLDFDQVKYLRPCTAQCSSLNADSDAVVRREQTFALFYVIDEDTNLVTLAWFEVTLRMI